MAEKKEKKVSLSLGVQEAADLAHAAREASVGKRPLYDTDIEATIIKVEDAVAKAE